MIDLFPASLRIAVYGLIATGIGLVLGYALRRGAFPFK